MTLQPIEHNRHKYSVSASSNRTSSPINAYPDQNKMTHTQNDLFALELLWHLDVEDLILRSAPRRVQLRGVISGVEHGTEVSSRVGAAVGGGACSHANHDGNIARAGQRVLQKTMS